MRICGVVLFLAVAQANDDKQQCKDQFSTIDLIKRNKRLSIFDKF